VTLPGGAGTLEEFFEIWVGHYLKFHTKPVVILDPFGIYAPLHELIVHLEDEKFIKPGMREIVQWTTTVDEALRACQP
jgi:predicted Rossmann-fold nucleotide-binding protein